MKRALSILMVCALLIAGLATLASAEVPVSLAITAEKNENVLTAQVKLLGYTQDSWSGMTVTVDYDQNVLTYTGAKNLISGEYAGMEVMEVSDNDKATIGLCWFGDVLRVPDDGIVAELTFDIKDVEQATNVQLSASFLPKGMMAAGSTVPMPQEGNYAEESVQSAPVEILPEQPDDPDEPVDPEEPTNPTIITSTTGLNNKVSIGVNAKYISGGNKQHNYKINISWTDMTYTFNAKEKWNTNDLKWDMVTEDAYWTEADPAEIVVTNYSSLPVTAKAEYVATVLETTFAFGETVEAAKEEPISVSLDAFTEGTLLGDAPQKKIYAIFNSNGAVINQKDIPLGTIKVTIA